MQMCLNDRLKVHKQFLMVVNAVLVGSLGFFPPIKYSEIHILTLLPCFFALYPQISRICLMTTTCSDASLVYKRNENCVIMLYCTEIKVCFYKENDRQDEPGVCRF